MYTLQITRRDEYILLNKDCDTIKEVNNLLSEFYEHFYYSKDHICTSPIDGFNFVVMQGNSILQHGYSNLKFGLIVDKSLKDYK